MSRKLKVALLVIYDVCVMILSCFFSYWLLRLSGNDSLQNMLIMLAINLVVCEMLFVVLGVYKGMMKYSGIHEGTKISIACLALLTVDVIISFVFKLMPLRWSVVGFLIFFVFTFFARSAYRVFKHLKEELSKNTVDILKKRVMIVGGGDAGFSLIKEIHNTPTLNMQAVCIIDDDKSKQNTEILGVPIVGTTADIIKIAEKKDIDNIIVAMPSVSRERVTDIYNICKETPCQIQTLPGLYQFVEGKGSILSAVKDVEINDLLGREPIEVNLDEIMGYIENQTVLVTGAGGSIGSELCRQIARHNPKFLILFDIYENTTYYLELELKRENKKINMITLIGSVCCEKKLDNIFKKYKPDIIFHAAAYKHVPLMETSPCEAIKNNVFGTLNVAKMADKYKSKRMVLISTDKAVNPTSLMGATKRICEMIIQTMAKKAESCEYVAVRFGNVLGSNGSVIPIFKEQIKKGGPVTVTDPEMTRYFMTIPEAVSLVLQAGSYAKGGEIFVLDMGEPVKIYDLAVNMIKLSGFQPNVDMDIEIIGLRPGEKMYEETLMKEEGLKQTANKLIHIGKPLEIDDDNLCNLLEELHLAATSEIDKDEMKKMVTKIVPTYHITNNE